MAKYKEQYERAKRYLKKLMQLKEVSLPYVSPDCMNSEELADYGLTTEDCNRIQQWQKQISPDWEMLDEKQLNPVCDILNKWIIASVNLSPKYLDTIYTFFQHCYHLKDWIKNDPGTSSNLVNRVEKFISCSPALSLCADICNASKHLTLRPKEIRSGQEPKVAGFGLAFVVDDQSLTVALKRATVRHGEKEIDIFDLAQQCMQEWKVFLEE